MNVLFLTVSAGGGHMKAAESMQDSINKYFPDSNTYSIDAYKYASPLMDKLLIGGYLKTLKTVKLKNLIFEKKYEKSKI